ncbi:MAG: cobalt-precorrin-6A reductase [Pseudomonadota bacterium]
MSQGASAIEPNVLVLGGTTEATALCREIALHGVRATLSFAGRVARPAPQAVPVRVGGFGGVTGLTAYLHAHAVTHVVDATHPFAANMSANAAAAAEITGVPLIALTRAPWSKKEGDRWTNVPDIAHAVAALTGPRASVMLAIGRMSLGAFASQPQHRYLLRLVDPPEEPPPFPEYKVIVARGPFSVEGDIALMKEHAVDIVVSKNSGGGAAQAKILAARALGLPMIMVARPEMPERPETHDVGEVLRWITHGATRRGV